MKTVLLAAVYCLVPMFAAAERAIEWSDLIDSEAQVFDDPFRALTVDQIDLLRTVVRSREKLARGTAPEEDVPEIEGRLAAALNTLAEAGVDADRLIEQRWIVAGLRETAANAGNPALDGVEISLAGFAIPGPPEADGTSTVYLVEMAGMCSHTPPPMPNQLVRVRFENGWTPSYMHQPVRIGGRAVIAPSERVFQVVDGDVPMKATWRLDATKVETQSARPPAGQPNADWVERLRAGFAAK